MSSETWTAVAAWIACLLTAGVAGPDVWDRLHGAKIEVSPARQFLLYRDGSGDRSIMWIAFDTTILNRSRFPDTTESVVLRISGPPGGHEAAFRAESLVQPIFSTSDDDRVECPSMVRCIRKRQMTIGEERAEVINLSGGSARSFYIGFPLSMGNCITNNQACRDFVDFDDAMQILKSRPDVTFTIELSMAEDGLKQVSCALSEEAQRGWTQILERTGESGWAIGNCQ